MPDIEGFTRACKDRFGMRPVLPLGHNIRPGAVGVIKDGVFEQGGSIRSILGVSGGGALPKLSPKPVWDLTSGRDVQIRTVASVDAKTEFPELPKAKARVEIKFNSKNSFLAAAQGVQLRTLSEPHRVLEAMMRAYPYPWDPNYVFVYEVGIPKGYTAVLSSERGTALALGAKGSVDLDRVATGDLAVGFKLLAQSQDCLKLLCEGKIPAFYNAYKVKLSFWTGIPRIDRAVAPSKKGQRRAVSLEEALEVA